MNSVDKIIPGIYAAFVGTALSLGGYATYLDFTDEALENVSPLTKKYDENKDNNLQLSEAIKLVVNEFDKNKDGYLSKEEYSEIDSFRDKFRGRLQHANIQKARQMLSVASAYCGEWGEDPKHLEVINRWESDSVKEVLLNYFALRNSKK